MIMGKTWLSGQPHLSHDHEIERHGGELRRNARRPARLGGDTSEIRIRIAGLVRFDQGKLS
ncbi:hypothetical protein Drose_31060 [Dactylosporangium roseum]|uniref:Uncharacterized protein n=1 Tax=Dactylosporangium roseum TaxID=47989 RepID=A0ABY5Z376_9ACTN|nr:hypothetical protein [Dactylosporangium roseum]UWZ35520.1 hypothetical protein Drose_31060 [Dactylosporangium roseum]